jgi:hypothetical protein
VKHVKGYLFVVGILLHVTILSGCGYAPSSKFARQVMGDKVSTEVVVSSIDPQNTVLIKDAVDSAVIQSFQASLTDKEQANTHLKIALTGVNYTPTQYDSNGYIVGYRTVINLSITSEHEGITKQYNVSGNYDFSISANAIISDQVRFDAIKGGASKAITSFVAQVSAQGARDKKVEQ